MLSREWKMEKKPEVGQDVLILLDYQVNSLPRSEETTDCVAGLKQKSL